jgi:hypothetical protein
MAKAAPGQALKQAPGPVSGLSPGQRNLGQSNPGQKSKGQPSQCLVPAPRGAKGPPKFGQLPEVTKTPELDTNFGSQGKSLNEPQTQHPGHQNDAQDKEISDLQQPSQSVKDSSNHASVKKTKIPKATLDQWHQRLAHLSRTQIRKLHAAKLIHIIRSIGDLGPCDTCLESKATKKPSPTSSSLPKAARPFKRLHFDLIGGQSSFPNSSGLYKYILLVTDDYTGYSWAWAIKSKGQAVSKLL